MCFAIIERQALRRGDFASVEDLVAAIGRLCHGWNQRCRPFAWTKDANHIPAKLNNVLCKAGFGCAGLVRWAGDARAASDDGVWHADGESGDRSDG